MHGRVLDPGGKHPLCLLQAISGNFAQGGSIPPARVNKIAADSK